MDSKRSNREVLSYNDDNFTKRLNIATAVKTFFFENHYTNYYSDREIIHKAKSSLTKNANKTYSLLEIGTSWFPNFINILNRKFSSNIYNVTAINISENEIQKHRQLITKINTDNINKINYQKMNAEVIDFNDATHFDVVIGGAILHHINYENTLKNLNNFTDKKSILIFREPLAHNPILNIYRFLTPFLHTEDEEPINLYDFIKISNKLNYKLEVIYQEGLSPLLFPLNIISKIFRIRKLAKLISLIDYHFSNCNLFKSFSRIATFLLIPID